MNVYAAVKQAMQDLVAPQLESLKADLKVFRADMEGGFTGVQSELRRLDDKLTWALDLRERIVALETKAGM